MDRQKSKKIRNARIIATNIFMSISVVAIVFILMLVAMGFSFDESGELKQSGLLQLYSHPSGANVEIDHESQFSRTDFSRMLSGGKHLVRISKDGYSDWQKDVRIDSGLLTRIEWIRLFPNNPEISNVVDFNNIRFANFSKNRKYLVVAEKGNDALKVLNITDDNIQPRQISLDDCLDANNNESQKGDITIAAWNNDGSKALFKWVNNNNTSWHLVDLEHADKSINLSKKFNLNFDTILVSNDSASKLWAVENGNLRLINANNSTISSIIATNILKIANDYNTVAFVSSSKTDGGKTEYSLNIFHENEEGVVTIKQLDSISDNTTINLAIGKYWNEEWLIYSINQHLTVLGGQMPNHNKESSKKLEEHLSRDLDYTPTRISVNANQRVIVLSSEKSLVSFDFETKDYYDADLDENTTVNNINWLDDYILWHKTGDSIVVRDFDGDNRRTIIPSNNTTLPVVISENGRWLYYFEMSTSDEGATLTFTLKREKL